MKIFKLLMHFWNECSSIKMIVNIQQQFNGKLLLKRKRAIAIMSRLCFFFSFFHFIINILLYSLQVCTITTTKQLGKKLHSVYLESIIINKKLCQLCSVHTILYITHGFALRHWCQYKKEQKKNKTKNNVISE